MDEKQAIHNLKQHDLTALTWLVDHTQVKALRTVYLITQERRQAEDIVQETYLDLPDLIRSFDETRPFEPWFMRVLVHRALRTASHHKQFTEFPDWDETDCWLDSRVTDPAGPEDRMHQTELQELIWSKMQQLSSEQRAAVVMRYYLQMSEQEMASLSTVPAGTIKWRLSAARSRLRKLFVSDPRKDEE
jgi:RNA polymerase sigma-70 factor, ECF subfamily